VDSRGAVVWQAACLPYGEAKVLKATVQNNLRFPGQYFDAETGLHYNWTKYYNPKTGKYITADPIGIAGGMNLYAYVGGDPINGYDLERLTKRDPNSQYCKSLAQRIRNLESELEKRYREYEEDPLNLPERIGPGEGLHETRRGHRTKINETDSRLRKNLQQYMDECGGPPPAPGFEPSEEMCGDDCKKVAKTAALLGAGYVVYKIGKICVLTFVGGPVGFGVGVVTP